MRSHGLHPWLRVAAPAGLDDVWTDLALRVRWDRVVPQSFGDIYLHAVFATKNREPLIIDPEPARLHAYLAAVLAELGCPSLATGGIEDHVHILHVLRRMRSVAWVMEKLKANSSRPSAYGEEARRGGLGCEGVRCEPGAAGLGPNSRQLAAAGGARSRTGR